MDYNKSTFEGVIRKSIKSFKEGQIPEETFKRMSDDGKEVKYTPDYFDTLEEQVLEEKEKLDKKEKKKSKKKKPLKMSEGGTPTEEENSEEEEKTPGKDIGTAAAEGLMAIGKGIQEAYDGELDPNKMSFSGTTRR